MADEQTSLRLASVQLKHFRCFNERTFDFDHKVIVLCGVNGVGKTSLLEALYYACYLRSFRTHLPRDLIAFGNDSFFVKVAVRDAQLDQQIQVGFSGAKRLVKVNQQTVSSYKDLMQHYRVVSVTEDDLGLITGSPQVRRTFIDHALVLADPAFITKLRAFRAVLDQRNKLLHHGAPNPETYAIWTKQLWERSHDIQQARKQLLADIQNKINVLLHTYFDDSITISFSYQARKQGDDDSFEALWQQHDTLMNEEVRYGRSLFGAHLDDVIITLEGKRSKSYASRGQQKLIVVLIKIAQIMQLSAQKGPAVFLLDDFMTDFDSGRLAVLLSILLSLDNQLIFTAPTKDSSLERQLKKRKVPHKILTI